MKRLMVVRGTMGVGKTAVCCQLLKLLTPGHCTRGLSMVN